jgi:hypothetical protein
MIMFALLFDGVVIAMLYGMIFEVICATAVKLSGEQNFGIFGGHLFIPLIQHYHYYSITMKSCAIILIAALIAAAYAQSGVNVYTIYSDSSCSDSNLLAVISDIGTVRNYIY